MIARRMEACRITVHAAAQRCRPGHCPDARPLRTAVLMRRLYSLRGTAPQPIISDARHDMVQMRCKQGVIKLWFRRMTTTSSPAAPEDVRVVTRSAASAGPGTPGPSRPTSPPTVRPLAPLRLPRGGGRRSGTGGTCGGREGGRRRRGPPARPPCWRVWGGRTCQHKPTRGR